MLLWPPLAAICATPALAAQPFEGSWCNDGSQSFTVDSKTLWDMEQDADGNGNCRITKARKTNATTWNLDLRCQGRPARYTIRMMTPDKAVFSKVSRGYVPVAVERCDD